jgi:hypothetical protein
MHAYMFLQAGLVLLDLHRTWTEAVLVAGEKQKGTEKNKSVKMHAYHSVF